MARAVVSLENRLFFARCSIISCASANGVSWRYYQVLGKLAIKGVVYLIEDETQKVESRGEH